MTHSWLARSLIAASLVLTAPSAALAADPPGDLWEMTSQPVMEGMPMAMPSQTQKVCTAKTWTAPPPGRDESCVTSDFERSGDKVTWSVACSGEMSMSGTGEITFTGPDAYTGQVALASDEMSMTVRLSGKKVGECDNPR